MSHLVCQDCTSPIKIGYQKGVQDALSDLKSTIHSFSNEDLENSFVLLEKMDRMVEIGEDVSNYAQVNKALTLIYDAASSEGYDGFPLCTDCVAKITAEQMDRITRLENDHFLYKSMLDEFKAPEPVTLLGEAFEVEERALHDKLYAIRRRRSSIENQIDAMKKKRKDLVSYEKTFWDQLKEFEVEEKKFMMEHNRMTSLLHDLGKQRDALNATNIYDDTFHITQIGHFAAINGFRLGRLKKIENVSDNEINAAFGQVVTLLDSVARNNEFKFAQHLLVPNGSYSRIERMSDKASFNLYTPTTSFWNRNFDCAVSALLICIREFGIYASEVEGKEIFRYTISESGDTIGGVQSKLNNEEKWTKAMKYMMINLKTLLLWSAKHDLK